MATYTSNYGWTKPSGSDNVDISVLNNNLDNQDSTIHDAFLNMAPPFSESSTYAVDDIVLYGTGLYKCHTAVVTPGSWTGSTNWQVYKLSEGGSGGGGYVLPTATASRLGGVKIGSGINVEEDGTISAGGGGSSLEAGDYIEIDENDKINVKMEKGDTTEYEYRFTGAYSPSIQLTIEKYRDGVLVSTESYQNDASYTPIAIDGLFEIWYSAGNPRYYWHYKLLEDSQEHSAGYEDSWYYTDTTTRTETFDVEDDSLTLVRKGDLATVATSGSYADLSNKPTIPTSASGISYDNTDSGLSATDVQGAVDELRQADNIMMSDGVTSVEDALDGITKQATKVVSIGTVTYVNGHAMYTMPVADLALPSNATILSIYGSSNNSYWADFVVGCSVVGTTFYIYLGTNRSDGEYSVGDYTIKVNYI